MEFVVFTKPWPQAAVRELARMAKGMGADGLDLCVRAGHPVNPDNVAEALPHALTICREEGVTIGMVSMETKPTDPRDPATEAIFRACGEAGIGLVKPGYWRCYPGDYWQGAERAREALAALGRMAAAHGVVACYHTHSGPYYGSNAAGLMHLLRGQDAAALGAYLDVGHLAINGERLPMAFDMVRGYLRCIGVKSPAWEKSAEGAGRPWRLKFVRLSEGLVDAKLMFAELKRVGFDGVLSFHGEHSLPLDEIPRANHADIAWCRQLLKES